MSHSKRDHDESQQDALGESQTKYTEPGSKEEALFFAKSALASLMAGEPFEAQLTLEHFISLRENWGEAN